jgi:hypothetical protein
MSTFDYTNRDYTSIRTDLLNRASVIFPEWTSRDSSDFGMLFIDLVSYMGDILHYYVDQAARESFLETATRRSSLLAIASLLDYIPHGRTSAQTTITLDATNSLATDVSPILIPVNTKFTASPLVETAESVIFTSNQSIAFNSTGTPISGYTTYAKTVPATVRLTEGEFFTETFTSNGQISQRYTLSKIGVVKESIVVTVAEGVLGADVSYSQVTRLIENTNSDKVYVANIEADDSVVLQFGNGIHGKIPATNAVVTITYRKSRGSAGNVEANSVTSFYSLSNAYGPTYDGILITPNTTRAFGGSNSESITSLKSNIPTSFRSQDRAVSLQDYEDLVLRIPGVIKTKAEIVSGATAKQGIITNKAKTSSVATLTTSANHGLSAGEYVGIFNVDDTFDGTYVITGTPTPTSFTYALVSASVASASVASTATYKNAQVKIYALTPQDTYDGTLAVSPTTSPLTLDTNYRDSIYDYIVPREIAGVNSLVITSVALDLVKITCNVSVLPSYIQDAVKEDVEIAIKALFEFDNVSFGQTITLGTLYRAILDVDGVDYVSVSRFTTGGSNVIDTASLIPTVEGVQASANRLLLLSQLSVTASGGVASV